MTVKELKELLEPLPADALIYMVNLRELIPDIWRIKKATIEGNPLTNEKCLKLFNYRKGEE